MLFGVEAPKMIVNIDTTLDEVALDYCVILKDEPELDTFTKRSVRIGKKVFTNAGKHWLFKIKIHLWKYADPPAKYLEFKSYEGTQVYLYRHSDGDPIYDKYNNKGVFVLTSVNESYTDEYNLYDVLTLTFRSAEKIKEIIVPGFTPADITDLNLWFADDTVENLLSNNFKWTDKVNGVIYLEGNYGTGEGITQLNGNNVLHTVGSNNTNMLHGGNILNFDAWTFVGLIRQDLPQGTPGYACHYLEQVEVIPKYNFVFREYVSGGSGSAGFRFKGSDGFANNFSIGLSGSVGSANINTPPHKLSLAFVRFTYNGAVKLYLDGTEYSTTNDYTKRSIEEYHLNDISGVYWSGLIGEFMYYSRALTDEEINLLGYYYKNKYGVEFVEL